MRVLLLISIFGLSACKHTVYEAEWKCDDRTVVEIGGCSGYRYISCPVKLNDGSRENMEYPMVGDKFCKKDYIKKEID